jgi:hypothetical protein
MTGAPLVPGHDRDLVPVFEAAELDLFARAFDRAIQAAPPADRDPEQTKAILMTGIMDAARRGVRNEDVLTDAALSALVLYEDDAMDAVMRETPL